MKKLTFILFLLISTMTFAQQYSKVQIIDKDNPTIVQSVDITVEQQGDYLVFENSNLHQLDKLLISKDTNIVINTNRKNNKFSQFEMTKTDSNLILNNKQYQYKIVLTR